MPFEDISIFSSSSHFVQQSGTVWAFGIMRNIHMNYFEFGPVVQWKMLS